MNKVMIALLAGFVAGILLAPDKGSVTRKKLSDGLNDVSDKLTDLKETFSSEVEGLTKSIPAKPKMSSAI